VTGHSLAIVDESHHFRNPATRRYENVAPWLVGRPVLLLSGTPVVNRLMDLGHQLLLAVRDDCLRSRGCPSLLEALAGGSAPVALDDLVLCRRSPESTPIASHRVFPLTLTPAERMLVGGIERLSLSRDPSVASLIRIVLWRALGSSPAALAGALARYDRLLHHAALAGRSGRGATRAAIRAFAGRDQEQLVFWELFPEPAGEVELALQDRAPLELLLQQARGLLGAPDTKCERLQALLRDGVPTIVFTGARDTLTWLRGRLADRRPAWLTGEAAGIGTTRMAREDVLQHFSPRCPSAPASTPGIRSPHLLLATDVAAEGLDLQEAGRVVHYDLPWTSVRVDQRNGRALRLGARWERVEIVEFHPPPDLEERLRQLVRLAAKRRLSSHAGIDSDGRWLYRWRSDLAAWAGAGPAAAGVSVAEGGEGGWLVGLAFDAAMGDRGMRPMPASLIWIGDDGRITEHPKQLAELLQAVARRPWRAPSPEERGHTLAALAPVVRSRLREATGENWRNSRWEPEQRALERRLRALAARGARQRDRELLVQLDAAREWLAGGLSAGEAALVRVAARLETSALLPALRRLLERPRRNERPVPRLTGVVRVGTFSGCFPSGPYSSISTER
jgi:hypothetical protein